MYLERVPDVSKGKYRPDRDRTLRAGGNPEPTASWLPGVTVPAILVAFVLAAAFGRPAAAEQHREESPAHEQNAGEAHSGPAEDGHGAGEAGHAAGEAHGSEPHGDHAAHAPVLPNLAATLPFVIILLCIAILPLVPKLEHTWHKNEVKLGVAVVLAVTTLAYYYLRGRGILHGDHLTGAGLSTVKAVLTHAVLDEYVPFIVLLFSLYTISGGIRLSGDLRASPLTNTTILAVGAGMASFVGTTGASMLLIRPLLQTNSERKHVRHTVIFFIFLVSNIGGSLLPIGDPPLFLGYLYGVPFLWTLNLVVPWAVCVVILLVIYFVWDTLKYRSESVEDLAKDESERQPMRLEGGLNFIWLLGVILSVAFLVPGNEVLGFQIRPFVREIAQLVFVAIAWATTAAIVRKENEFNFFAIAEVAALFIGIFITMQVPIEFLKISADSIAKKVNTPWQFFWMTGSLSSFLDNAPTYAVFFNMAKEMTASVEGGATVALKGGGAIRTAWLTAISIGAVFMGANTYIGNGPNFMVKSIAEQSGIRMPSFFGYFFRYSVPILLPVFVIITLIFFRQ